MLAAAPPSLYQPNWHIALTEPQSERHASEGLRSRGYEAYFPIFPKTIRHFRNGPNRVRTVIRPLFPGYLFVVDRLAQGWLRLEKCPGIREVHSLLRRCGSPEYACLPASAIDAMRAKETALCKEQQTLTASHGLKIGEMVRIEEGPFTGLFAQIETLDDHERIGLLMSLFGRESRVSLPAECLASAS
jgi:transcription antitermination factor NusG